MANMRAVNKAIKAAYPGLQIEAVRGDGYVYFDGNDGFDKIESVYCHSVTTATEDMIRVVLDAISWAQNNYK